MKCIRAQPQQAAVRGLYILRVKEKMGTLDNKAMNMVNKAISVSLGLS